MQIKEQVSPHVSPLVLKASAEMTTPSVKWLLPLYCSLHVLCWMFLLFSFVLYEIKQPSSICIILSKQKWMSLILHMFFCCCNVHIVFVYCKKKSCQYFMNNAWALPMFNLFFFSIFISKSYYETLLYFPHAFYIIFLLKKIPLDLLHTMLLQACWYKNTVSSSLQCTCTCMNVRQYVR